MDIEQLTEPDAQSDLTREQRAIVHESVDARLLVTAPAGTGKTHVLVARLMTFCDADFGEEEVLVLSFSRAAVAEVKTRVRKASRRWFGDIRTFDSLATSLLLDADPGRNLDRLSYEDRIVAAIDVLQSGKSIGVISRLRHVIIDEFQDLVGPRADFVIALLERVDCGGTFLGDPSQAIYDYGRRATATTTNAQLYEWIRGRYGVALIERELTHDFRGSTPFTPSIAAIGRDLRAEKPDHVAIESKLRSVLLQLQTTTTARARRIFAGEGDETIAILCRTNGDALEISEQLHAVGVVHDFRRRSEDKVAAPWLAQTLLGVDGTRTATRTFENVLETNEAGFHPPRDAVRRIRLAIGASSEVDLKLLADRIRTGTFDEGLAVPDSARVVVSTIHRAKGLEFSSVLICEPGPRKDADLGEENRVLYVALTRAQKELWHVPRAEAGTYYEARLRRWMRKAHPRSRFVTAIEVNGSDVDGVYPPGSFGFTADAAELQRYLLTEVHDGDEVVVTLTTDRASDAPLYLITHRDRIIGVTSERFGLDVANRLGRPEGPPAGLSGLRVEAIETVAGDAFAAQEAGLGRHGIWGRVRVRGLATIS